MPTEKFVDFSGSSGSPPSAAATGLTEGGVGRTMGTLAVALAAVNVFGGFLVTQRMLQMFRKKEPRQIAGKEGGK